MPARRACKRRSRVKTRSGRPGRRARAFSFVNPAYRDGLVNKDCTAADIGDGRQGSRAFTDCGLTTNSAPDSEEARLGEVVFKGARRGRVLLAAVVGAVVLAGGIALTVS